MIGYGGLRPVETMQVELLVVRVARRNMHSVYLGQDMLPRISSAINLVLLILSLKIFRICDLMFFS